MLSFCAEAVHCAVHQAVLLPCQIYIGGQWQVTLKKALQAFLYLEYYMLLFSITISIRKHMNSLLLYVSKSVINFYSQVYWTFSYKCCKQKEKAHQFMLQRWPTPDSNFLWDLSPAYFGFTRITHNLAEDSQVFWLQEMRYGGDCPETSECAH